MSDHTDYANLHWATFDYQMVRDRAKEIMDTELAAFKADPNNGVPRYTHIDDCITWVLAEEVYPMAKHFREVVKTHVVWVNCDKEYDIPDRHKVYLTTLINAFNGNCKVIKDRTGIMFSAGKAVGWHLIYDSLGTMITEYPIVIHPDQYAGD